MDEMYRHHSTPDYSDKPFLSPENLIQSSDYHSLLSSAPFRDRFPVFGSDELLPAVSVVSESTSVVTPEFHRRGVDEGRQNISMLKAKIASHPCYPRLLQAYLDCQKVGAPPEITCLLAEIRRDNDLCKRDAVSSSSSSSMGADPELDEFMESYCDILGKYKSDLARPFDEATTFLNKIEMQLSNLCGGGGGGVSMRSHSDEDAVSSGGDYSGGETEIHSAMPRNEERDLKDRLFHRFGDHIGTLKLEFSKNKKKKGKLPREARQTLLAWWDVHYKWPYPTEADKIALAESTGLDQKQINNWFINQRKRHWKPSENMQFGIMDNNNNNSGLFFSNDDD